LGTASLATVYVIAQLIRAYWSYEYQYLANSVEQLEYYDRLRAYYSQIGKEEPEKVANGELESSLIRNYAEASAKNARNNIKKSAILHKANNGLVCLVISISMSVPLFYIGSKFDHNLSKTKGEVHMSADDKNPPSAAQEQKPSPDQKPAVQPTSEKPEAPKNVNLREFNEGNTKHKEKLNE
jgi:hypothetical protein